MLLDGWGGGNRLKTWALVLAPLGLVVTAGVGTAAPTVSQPQWQTVRIKYTEGSVLEVLGWASGRAWFAVQTNGRNVTIWSARVQARRRRTAAGDTNLTQKRRETG